MQLFGPMTFKRHIQTNSYNTMQHMTKHPSSPNSLSLCLSHPTVESHGIFPDPGNSDSENLLSSSHPNQVPSDSITPEPVPLYSWLAITTSPCSVTCGTGIIQLLAITHCLYKSYITVCLWLFLPV